MGGEKLLGGSYNTSGKTGRLDRASDNERVCTKIAQGPVRGPEY